MDFLILNDFWTWSEQFFSVIGRFKHWHVCPAKLAWCNTNRSRPVTCHEKRTQGVSLSGPNSMAFIKLVGLVDPLRLRARRGQGLPHTTIFAD